MSLKNQCKSAFICVQLQLLGNIILKISPNIQCDTTDFWRADAISNEICRNLQNKNKCYTLKKMTKIVSIPDSYRYKFANIPAKLFPYFDSLLKKPSGNSQFHLAMNHHPEKTFEVLDRQFSACSKIVSLSPDDLLKKLDFQSKDLSPERIESLLGELRTIHFLDNNGFTNITPIRANSTKSPDFSAEKNGDNFLIEVVTSIYFAPRNFHNTIVKLAISRLQNDDKLSQMNTGSAIYKNLFVCILNSLGAVALNKRSDYLIMLKEIWEKVGSIQNLYIAIVTGKTTIDEGLDDCVYPSFDRV